MEGGGRESKRSRRKYNTGEKKTGEKERLTFLGLGFFLLFIYKFNVDLR
jgi:hypothetical protein